ncbi:MAG: hypothetical protein EOM18_00615 [Clostridia bacterium]|nr:hypothetical protein [Clostridia bacterium]
MKKRVGIFLYVISFICMILYLDPTLTYAASSSDEIGEEAADVANEIPVQMIFDHHLQIITSESYEQDSLNETKTYLEQITDDHTTIDYQTYQDSSALVKLLEETADAMEQKEDKNTAITNSLFFLGDSGFMVPDGESEVFSESIKALQEQGVTCYFFLVDGSEGAETMTDTLSGIAEVEQIFNADTKAGLLHEISDIWGRITGQIQEESEIYECSDQMVSVQVPTCGIYEMRLILTDPDTANTCEKIITPAKEILDTQEEYSSTKIQQESGEQYTILTVKQPESGTWEIYFPDTETIEKKSCSLYMNGGFQLTMSAYSGEPSTTTWQVLDVYDQKGENANSLEGLSLQTTAQAADTQIEVEYTLEDGHFVSERLSVNWNYKIAVRILYNKYYQERTYLCDMNSVLYGDTGTSDEGKTDTEKTDSIQKAKGKAERTGGEKMVEFIIIVLVVAVGFYVFKKKNDVDGMIKNQSEDAKQKIQRMIDNCDKMCQRIKEGQEIPGLETISNKIENIDMYEELYRKVAGQRKLLTLEMEWAKETKEIMQTQEKNLCDVENDKTLTADGKNQMYSEINEGVSKKTEEWTGKYEECKRILNDYKENTEYYQEVMQKAEIVGRAFDMDILITLHKSNEQYQGVISRYDEHYKKRKGILSLDDLQMYRGNTYAGNFARLAGEDLNIGLYRFFGKNEDRNSRKQIAIDTKWPMIINHSQNGIANKVEGKTIPCGGDYNIFIQRESEPVKFTMSGIA